MSLVGLFRGVLAGILAIAAVVAIFVFALNFYLGLPGNAAWLRNFVSKKSGVNVGFSSAQVNLFTGAEAEQLQIANPFAHAGPPLLTAPKADATYAVLAFLSQKRLLVRHLAFEQPVITFSLERPAALPPTSGFGGRGRAPIDIKSLNIRGGTLRVLDGGDRPAFVLSGLDHGGRLARAKGDLRASGQFSARALAAGGLSLANVEGSYSLEDGVLQAQKLSGSGYHAQWTGTLKIDGRAPGFPCEFRLQAASIDLNEFLKAVAGRPDLVSGALNLDLDWRGPLGTLDNAEAQGSFDLRDGQLIAFGFLQDLARALVLPELAQPDISAGRGDIAVANGAITLSNFTLKTVPFDLSGGGTIGFDGTANLQLRIAFNADFVRRLPEAVVRRLAAAPDGSRAMAFTLAGPVDRLQSDLLKRLSGIDPQAPAQP